MFRTGWKRWWVIGSGLCPTVTLALSLPISADAGLISGRVSDERGTFRAGGTFSVKLSAGKTVQVKTDAEGNYRVFLPPGIYTVEFSDGRSAEILSHPEPIKQDIRLK